MNAADISFPHQGANLILVVKRMCPFGPSETHCAVGFLGKESVRKNSAPEGGGHGTSCSGYCSQRGV